MDETTTGRGYGWDWQQIRAEKLKNFPLCEFCEQQLATQVHHANHDTTDNRPQNLISVCQPCHNALEADYRRRNRR